MHLYPSGSTDASSVSRSRIASAVEEFLAQSGRPGGLNKQEFLQLHSDIAEQLAPCIEGLELLQHATFGFNELEGNQPSFATQQLGDFRLIAEIGRGGMGIVYEAEQLSLNRRVAVKVLPLASLLDKAQIARFKNEATAASMLKHPNVASVHAVGVERGVHYYVMDLVDGKSLSDIIAAVYRATNAASLRTNDEFTKEPEPTDDAIETDAIARISTQHATNRSYDIRGLAELGIQVADTLEYAHREGVIHRDIKPSNLILENAGRLFVTDFGLARIQEGADLTMTGDMVGTLRYMSPEQTQSTAVDHRTDIYSFGATFYELITGQPAVTGDNRAELVRTICESDPIPLRRHDSRVAKDLETIVHKCLRKSPAERYQTAGELAADLRRFLDHRPIHARRATRWNILQQWARRNPRLAVTSAVAMLALITLAAGGPLVAWRLNGLLAQRTELSRLQQQVVTEKEMVLYDSQIRGAAHTISQGDFQRARELLHDQPIHLRNFEWFYLSGLAEVDSRNTIERQEIDMILVAVNRDGKYVACANSFGRITIYDGVDHRKIGSVKLAASPNGRATVTALEFSPSGKQLFVGGEEFAKLFAVSQDPLQEWSAIAWPVGETISSANFSPNGQFLAIGFVDSVLKIDAPVSEDETFVEVYDMRKLVASKLESDITAQYVLPGLKGKINDLLFSPDGKSLYVAHASSAIHRWSVPSFQEMKPFDAKGTRVDQLAIDSHANNLVAVSSFDSQSGRPRSQIAVFDIEKQREIGPLITPSKRVTALSISTEGQHLATGHEDGKVCLWDFQTSDNSGIQMAPRAEFQVHCRNIRDLAFAPNRKSIFSVSADGCFKNFPISPSLRAAIGERQFTGRLSFFRDGTRLATCGYYPKPVLRIWDYVTGEMPKEVFTDKIHVTDIAILPSQQHVAYVGYGWEETNEKVATVPNEVGVWDIVTNQRKVFRRGEGKVSHISVSSTGNYLAASVEQRLLVFEIDSGKLIASPQFEARTKHAWHPQENLAAVGTVSGENGATIRLWSLDTRQVQSELPCSGLTPISIAFSPDGTQLAVGTSEGPILLWEDIGDPNSSRMLKGHDRFVWDVEFAPDGRRVVSAGCDASVRLWNLATGNELLHFKTLNDWNYAATFSHDGATLAYGGVKGTPTEIKIVRGKPLAVNP